MGASALYRIIHQNQIAGRDNWISLKAVADLLLGRVESHGVTFGDDSYMVEKLQIVGDEQKQVNSSTNVVAQSSVNRAVGMIRSFLEMYDKEVTPLAGANSQAILGDKLPEGFPGVDELSYSQQIYDQLSDADDQLEVVDFRALSEPWGRSISTTRPTITGQPWAPTTPTANTASAERGLTAK